MFSNKNNVTQEHCGQMKEFIIFAKEIQLCHPNKFSNIFLDIGGFHLEQVVNGRLVENLESSGIQNLVDEEEVCGSTVVWMLETI